MATALQAEDVLVGHMRDQIQQFRVFAEEMFAHEGAVLGLVSLVFAVHRLFHALAQQALGVAGQQIVPARAPHHFDDIPAGPAEFAFQFLDDLAVAAHRAVQALQIAVDDEDQVVQLLAPGQANRATRFRLVHLAVAHERPDLAALGFEDAPALQVLHEVGLVNRHDRPQAH